jgi:hypothetical protein
MKKNIFVLQSISAKRHFLKFIRVFFVLSITLTYTIFLGPTKVSAATISPVELSGSPTKDWRSISVSDDGTKIVAVNTNSLWTSSNSGSTWTERLPWGNWNSVKLSADGTKIFATTRSNANSYVHISNDFGATWTTTRPSGYECWDLCQVAISSDGTKVFLLLYGGGIYVSNDSGSTWTQTNTNRLAWTTIASSSDGRYVIAGQETTRYLYKSSDYGQTWNQLTGADSFNGEWVSVEISDDGQKLVATAYNNNLFTSADGGTNWTRRSAVSGTSTRVATSSNGNVIVASIYGSSLKVSTDSGATWDSDTTNRYWWAAAVTADGTKAFMGIGESLGKLYSLAVPDPPTVVSCSTSGTFTITSNVVTTNSSCTGTATIPSGVTSIAADAFKDATGLTAVSLPSSLTTIGTYAFKSTAITSLTIPNSVTSIGANAFFSTQINSLSLGTGLLTIGARAFSEMYPNPVDVTIPDSVTSLGDSAFEQSRLGTVVIGSGITTIPSQAFYNNYGEGVSSLTLGSNVTTIAGASFVGLRATSLTFPASVTTIGDRAFEGSQLQTITQSNNLSSLSTSAFQDSNSLTQVTYCGSNSTIQNYTYPNSVRSLCYSVPSAPTSLAATAGNGDVSIAFTAGSNGNSAITNYKYSTNGTTYTALSPADTTSPITISGLTNGTSYTIYLKAVNAIGDSVASSSVSATPVAPVEEPSCNAACQAAEAAAKAKADADAAALVAKKAAEDKAKKDAQELAAANERARQAAEQSRLDALAREQAARAETARLAAEQAEKDRLAAQQAALDPAQQEIVEQRSEAFNAFIAELPPIVPVEELALISNREDLPQYDPASEPEKNTAAQVAGFAAVSVLAAGGAATAMSGGMTSSSTTSSGGSSSGSSGGGSSGGGTARTASAAAVRREQESSDNKSLLEEIDYLSLKRKQDKALSKIKPGPGDNSFTWRLPYTQKWEDFIFVTSRKANRFAPIMAKLFADAAYLRAMIGSLSLITFPLAILMGLRALQDVENQALPPSWIVVATIAALGLVDAFAGLLTSFVFVAGILMAGNLTTLSEVLTVLGVTSLFFSPALVATSFRPIRRYTLNWDHRLERIGDYLIASVLTGWTLSKIIATFNVFAGVQLAIVADANKVGIAIGIFVFLRMFAEDFATYFYPQRLGKNNIEFSSPGKVQQLFSLIGKSFMFLLITQSFVGLNIQLVIGTIFFAIPILIKILFNHKLPKSKYLNYVLPKGTIRLIVMTITGTLCANFSSQFFANPRDLLTWGFVILSVPGLIFSLLGLFADESQKIDLKSSNQGRLVYLGGAILVFFLLSQIALNKDLLELFQGVLS